MTESRRCFLVLLTSSLLAAGGWSALTAQQPAHTPDIAVYLPVLSDSTNRNLRAVAESCVTRLVAQLAAESLVVVRRPPIDLVNLARARPARFAMVGKLELQAGKYSLEWNLLEVATGGRAAGLLRRTGAGERVGHRRRHGATHPGRDPRALGARRETMM